MRILVCGDRNWTDSALIWGALRRYNPAHLVVIHGAARGADTLAARAALEMGASIDRSPTPKQPLGGYPAEWGRYRRAAGPIRNQQMLIEGKPDLVLAFHDDLVHSKGTRDMLYQAGRAGVPCEVFSHA